MAHDHHTGVDHHNARSQMVVHDRAANTVRPSSARNGARPVAGLPLPYCGNAHRAMAARYDRTVMFDWLEEICDAVVLARPPTVMASAHAEIKTAKIDATVLASLPAGSGPDAWCLADRPVRSGVGAERKGNDPRGICARRRCKSGLSSFIGGSHGRRR